MILYRGPYPDAVLVATDVDGECPELYVGLVPSTARSIEADRNGEWTVLIANLEEVPMLEVFSFTDEQRRTFRWGMDEDRGETVILCDVYQDYSLNVTTPEGPKVRAMQVRGAGKGSTAQIAYDQALADLVVNLKDAEAKIRAMGDPEIIDVTLDEGPHRLFGKKGEE